MTPISLSGPHIVYYTLRFTFFYYSVTGRCEPLSDIWNIHKKAIQKKKVHNILLVGLVVRFVQISSIDITSHWFKKVYWSWLRVQNKFDCKLPNEGCMRIFSLFSSFKTVGLIGAFYGPSLRPLPIFATLLTYEISKFIIYVSLSIPEYSSLHPGPFKWIWIPTFAFSSFHSSPCTTPTKDAGGTPYNGLYGEAPPERGILFRPQVYERVGISLVEVYKRVGKSVIWVCERANR